MMSRHDETIGIQLLPGVILSTIVLEVARKAGQTDIWQQGAALATIARVSRSWCHLVYDESLWRRICESPEHWLMHDLAALALAARLTYRHLYRNHFLMSKSDQVNPCSTVGACRSPHQMAVFVEATAARQRAAQLAAHIESYAVSPTSEVLLLVRRRLIVITALTLTG
jgi:hypothetical protein